MGILVKIVLFSFSAIVIYLGIKINNIFQIPPIPNLKDEWWGPGKPTKENSLITPFKINISDKVIEDLNYRLNNARLFTKPLEGVQQQYGMNTDLLAEIVEFWKTKYSWREREKFLNEYPQFTTNIQGLKIHFLHVKPASTNGIRVLPLLLLHGWPGSFREYLEIIPLLITPQKGKDFVFEVIVPSLPGYGFSDGASKPGLGAVQMAVVLKNLMKRLDFENYYLEGGDWGAIIISHMATLFPEHILGLHSTVCTVDSPVVLLKLLVGSIYPDLWVNKTLEHNIYPLAKLFSYIMLEFGYAHLQATKPDTIGTGLNDSPVGLAAYILEKFTTWTKFEWQNRKDGGLKERYSYSKLLDNVMIYWVTNSITTSMRLYAETFTKPQMSLQMTSIPTNVPSVCANFENELFRIPDNLLKHKYSNLLESSDVQDGGHFAAFEVPDLVANDIWSAVDKFENYYKIK